MSKNYGSGEDQANPFFPGETMYEGSNKAIVSPHGSIFNVEVHKTNAMDERLKGATGPKGKTTRNESAPARKKGGKK